MSTAEHSAPKTGGLKLNDGRSGIGGPILDDSSKDNKSVHITPQPDLSDTLPPMGGKKGIHFDGACLRRKGIAVRNHIKKMRCTIIVEKGELSHDATKEDCPLSPVDSPSELITGRSGLDVSVNPSSLNHGVQNAGEKSIDLIFKTHRADGLQYAQDVNGEKGGSQ